MWVDESGFGKRKLWQSVVNIVLNDSINLYYQSTAIQPKQKELFGSELKTLY
jgi:hypothetical protein